MFQKIFTFYCFCFSYFLLQAQSIGEWRMHINYNNVISAASSSSEVLAANSKSIMLYNFDDGDVRTLDKVTGLSGYGISAVGHDDLTNTFVITYDDSNLDLLQGNTIINLPDIKNKLIAGSKSVNGIFCYEGFAYVCTDFGIVVIDIENEEVDNTYIIGSTGNQTIIYDCAISNDSIYALTGEGLKSAYLLEGNLLDYSVWNHNLSPNFSFNEVATHQDSLYAITDSSLYQFNSGNWIQIYQSDAGVLTHLYTSDFVSVVDDFENIITYENNEIDTLSISYTNAPSVCIKIGNNLIIGDKSFGLFDNGNKVFNFTNPFTNDGFRALSIDDKMVISSGGFNDNIDGDGNEVGGFYILENEIWTNHNIYTTIGQSQASADLNNMDYNPFNNKLYIAMFKGLLEFDFNTVNFYNKDNSPIDSVVGNRTVQRVSGVAVDDYGNTWIVNSGTSEALLALDLDGNWYEFSIGSDLDKYFELLIDEANQKWTIANGSGIRVYQEGDDLSSVGAQSVLLTTSSSNGNLPNANVNCLAMDKDGEIWAGTDEGIAVFSCPESVFDVTTGCNVSSRITSTLDLYTEYLFETDEVYTIEVDGANRKWIGSSSGVWLLSEDGKDVLLSFNTENSPLPSNEIFDIEINQNSGEVFILTSNGFVSYVSDATEGAEDHSDIKAYPNPVRPEYTGYISITGLVEGAFVKITDEHGVLVDEGYALGGKYIWDGNDYNGRRANSGVYYIFSANEDASEKAVTKVAFIK